MIVGQVAVTSLDHEKLPVVSVPVLIEDIQLDPIVSALAVPVSGITALVCLMLVTPGLVGRLGLPVFRLVCVGSTHCSAEQEHRGCDSRR